MTETLISGDPDVHSYDPADGHGLAHDPFKAIIAPRPVGWISTVDAVGRVNLAPYSFFNAVCERPPMLAFSSAGRKDTLVNVEATGEFVWNMATRALAEAMNETCRPLPHGEDEMAFAGLASAASTVVQAPRVAQSPSAMECKVVQITRLKGLDDVLSDQYLVIGQVVAVHIRREFVASGAFDTAKARPIARCGGPGDYVDVDQLFDMRRPR